MKIFISTTVLVILGVVTFLFLGKETPVETVKTAHVVSTEVPEIQEVEISPKAEKNDPKVKAAATPEHTGTKTAPGITIPEHLAHLVNPTSNKSTIIDLRILPREDGMLEIHFVEDRGTRVPDRLRYIRHEVGSEADENGDEVQVGKFMHLADQMVVNDVLVPKEKLETLLNQAGAEIVYAFREIPGRYSIRIHDPKLAAQDDLYYTFHQAGVQTELMEVTTK